MRVSYRWLQEFVPVELDPEDLADRLTLVGLAVDGVERPWRVVRGVVAATIDVVQAHPTSDRLRVVTVNTGQRTYSVVTGAPNAHVGMWVAFAPPGARLADGRTIGIAQFQGIESEGMCCSAEELALPNAEEIPGLLELDSACIDFRRGRDLVEGLGLDDAVFDFDLTPNYAAHCQSVLGVAREVSAMLELPLRGPATGPLTPTESPWTARATLPEVVIDDETGCSRYLARFLTDVAVGPSPLWLLQRLQTAGVRPVSNIVDVTNYVMLELGQPLHAFDLDRIRGGRIGPRAARGGETIMTLDGAERTLLAGDLVIADRSGPVAIAGVMGGEATEVRGTTRSILLESAWFQPRRIGGTARRLGLLSEASSRFEKGVDIEGSRMVADRAAALIQSLAGGKVAAEVADVYPDPFRSTRIPIDPSRVLAHLGVDIPTEQMTAYLARLGLDTEATASGVNVVVPSFRSDLAEPVDIVEEVGRMYGMNRIPSAPLPGAPGDSGRLVRDHQVREMTNIVRAGGFSEVVTFSFHPRAWLARLGLEAGDPRGKAIAVANPLSESHEVMRTTLLPSLLDALAYNRRVHRPDLAIFELARVYHDKKGGSLPDEPLHLGVLAQGTVGTKHFRDGRAAADFFLAKGVVAEICSRLRLPEPVWKRAEAPFLHPGRAAQVVVKDVVLGWVGEVHPQVLRRFNLGGGAVVAAELDVEAVLAHARPIPELHPVPRHPSVSRDLAVVFPLEVVNAEIERVMRSVGGELLKDVQLFDIYTGEQVAEGTKSLAYRLVYQDERRTLTDDEVETLHGAVRDALASGLGGVLRS